VNTELDPRALAKAVEATELEHQAERLLHLSRQVRTDMYVTARNAGWSMQQIANECGVSLYVVREATRDKAPRWPTIRARDKALHAAITAARELRHKQVTT
jgi:hypothetical protein